MQTMSMVKNDKRIIMIHCYFCTNAEFDDGFSCTKKLKPRDDCEFFSKTYDIGKRVEKIFEKLPGFEDDVDFDTFSKSDFRAVKIKKCEAVPKSNKLLQFVLNDGSGEDRIILSGIHEFYEPEELVGKTALAITNLPPRKMMGVESCGMLCSMECEYDGEEMLNFIILDDAIPAGAKLY